MKTVFLLFSLLLSNIVFASDKGWEQLILEKMVQSIYAGKEIRVYTVDESIERTLGNSFYINLVKNCNQCDIIIGENREENSCKKPKIVLKYRNYLNDKSAVGVFFWQKGRPTIRFSSEKLKGFGLHINGELSKFVTTKNN